MAIEFVVTIPIRQEDAQNVIDAFVNKRHHLRRHTNGERGQVR